MKEKIRNIVYLFASKAGINDTRECDNVINRLLNMNKEDIIDYIVISLNDLVMQGKIKQEDIFNNIELLLSLYPEKYSSIDNLLDRLKFLKSMNMEHPQMPLSENHKLVLEAFDSFNKIIGTNFDCYYTGGLMGYLATNHPLERYHGDLDLFINEEQLQSLYELVSKSDDFEFACNMDTKDETGHEFKINYKETPMSIGLFLFERKIDNSIVIKSYYYKDNNMFVNEHHLSSNYANIVFANNIREHNGISYRMQSLESIYNAKKNSRPKDRYDANVIKDYIDMNIEYILDNESHGNYDINGKLVEKNLIYELETIIKEKNKFKR